MYLSVTSQLTVESRIDRAENAWGLGWMGLNLMGALNQNKKALNDHRSADQNMFCIY